MRLNGPLEIAKYLLPMSRRVRHSPPYGNHLRSLSTAFSCIALGPFVVCPDWLAAGRSYRIADTSPALSPRIRAFIRYEDRKWVIARMRHLTVSRTLDLSGFFPIFGTTGVRI